MSGNDLPDNAADTIPVEQFIAPACVIDCSREAAADADFLLTRSAWRPGKPARPHSRRLLAADAHRLVQAPRRRSPIMNRGTAQHTPGPRIPAWCRSWSSERDVHRLRLRSHRHRCRPGRAFRAALSRATTTCTAAADYGLQCLPISTCCHPPERSSRPPLKICKAAAALCAYSRLCPPGANARKGCCKSLRPKPSSSAL